VPVCFYGRSGSYFLYSLLENHPEILALNSELREFWKIPSWHFDKSFEEQLLFILDTWVAFINEPGVQSFKNLYPGSPQVHVPRDINMDYGSKNYFSGPWSHIDRYKKPELSKFISYCYDIAQAMYGMNLDSLRLSRFELFKLLHFSKNLALGQKIPKSSVILYNLHVADSLCIKEIEKNIPCKIIHTIRSPLQSFGSHLKRYLDPGLRAPGDIAYNDVPTHVLSGILGDDCFLSGNKKDEFGVRLEDIHGKPMETLKGVLKSLGLRFNPCVLKETYNGGPYSFHNRDGTRVSGFGGKQLEKTHKDILTDNDALVLESILQDNYIKWNYPFRSKHIKSKAHLASSIDQLCDFDFIKEIESQHQIKIDRTKIREIVLKKLSTLSKDIFPVRLVAVSLFAEKVKQLLFKIKKHAQE